MKEVWKNKSFVFLTIAFSNLVGLYFAMGSFLSNFFNPFGQSPLEVAIIGLNTMGSGVLGSVISGIILDKTAAYKRLIQTLILIATVSLGIASYTLFTFSSNVLLHIMLFCLGFSMVAVIPSGLGLGVELTFPMQPALVNGIMLIITNINGTIQGLIYSGIMDFNPLNYDTSEEVLAERQRRAKMSVYPMMFFMISSIILMFFVKEDLKRVHYTLSQ